MSWTKKEGHMKTEMSAILVRIAMCASGAAQVSASSPATNAFTHYLSSREANRLLSTAATPEEHRQLAEFFRREAQRHRQKEQQYLDMEANCRVHPPRVDAYRNTPTGAYYDQLAQQARQLSFADDQLADYQTRVARELTESKSK
jgi:predicted tellurium resistance membrane protein TerC